jgi:hypothetical protein
MSFSKRRKGYKISYGTIYVKCLRVNFVSADSLACIVYHNISRKKKRLKLYITISSGGKVPCILNLRT